MTEVVPNKLTLEFSDYYENLRYIYEERFFLDEVYLRKPIRIVNTDNYVEVDISNLDTLEKLVAVVRDPFDPPSRNLMRLTIDNGTDPLYAIVLPFKKLFFWTIPEEDIETITKLEIKTSSPAPINIEILAIPTTDGD